MILSAEDLKKRLSHPRNSLSKREESNSQGNPQNHSRRRARGGINRNSGTHERPLDRNDIPSGGVYIRDVNQPYEFIPEELKIPATMLARLGGSNVDIAETLSISDSSVSTLKRKDNEIVNSVLESIRTVVVDKLEQTLSHLTPDKTVNSKASEIASVARSLAGILKDTSPDAKERNDNRVQIVIHSVNQKDDAHYEAIEV